MPLTNCKIHLELNWTNKYVISDNNYNTIFKINTKLCVQVVTLSSEDIVKLTAIK